MSRMIGLTGGIATGKSTVSGFLRTLGAAIIDADVLAREVVAPGSAGAAEIRARFGPEMFDADGALDRKRLGELVFSDAEARADLARITHPKIAALAQERAAEHRANGAPLIVYDAALLVENGLHRALSGLIVVSASAATQRARLIRRDALSPEAAQQRIDSQMPIEDKIAVANWVIDNDGSLEDTERQVREVWPALIRPSD